MTVALDAIRNEGAPTRVGVRCMGAVRFEATDLDAAEAFYRHALALEQVFRGAGPSGRQEVIFRFPSGQLVVVEEVAEIGLRTGPQWLGHHTAFHIEPGDYRAVDARITANQHLARSISHGERYDVSAEAIYVHDPSNDQLQISSYDADTSNEPPKAQHGAAIRELGRAAGKHAQDV